MLGSFVTDWFCSESHFVDGGDSMVDIEIEERSVGKCVEIGGRRNSKKKRETRNKVKN